MQNAIINIVFWGFCNAFKWYLLNLSSVLLMEKISNKCADKRTLNVPYMILAIFLFSNKKLVLIFIFDFVLNNSFLLMLLHQMF